MILGNTGLEWPELSPDPHENLRRNHWSCLFRITSCSDTGKGVNALTFNFKRIRLNLPAFRIRPLWLLQIALRTWHFFSEQVWTSITLVTCGSTKMHVHHICRWLCAFSKLMPWLKTSATIPHRTSCLTSRASTRSQRAVCFWKGDVSELTPRILWLIYLVSNQRHQD